MTNQTQTRQSWRRDWHTIRCGIIPQCESPTFVAAIIIKAARQSRVGFIMQRRMPTDFITALCLVNERCKAYAVLSTRRIL